ncbi:hypothetical protein C8Q77DRAFT_566404 [Trametes polyzona]|nr:hypothetical protein C8Q77DRAFT_566404 [Trametes polyzona]
MPLIPPSDLAKEALQDRSLSVKALVFKIVVQCRRAVQLATADTETGERQVDTNGDTPGLEGYLWDVWYALGDVTKKDPSRHEFLADVLSAFKRQGNEDGEWQVWRRPFDWANLPIWGATVAETMHHVTLGVCDDEGQPLGELNEDVAQSVLSGDPPSEDTVETRALLRQRTEWLNYNAFRARLWALGVENDSHWAMVMVSRELEPLSRPEEQWRAQSDYPRYPRELRLETALTWLRIAGAQMFVCRETWPKDTLIITSPGRSYGTWRGVHGYHPARWLHWKNILKAVLRGEKGEWRPNVIEAARSAVEAMDRVEEVYGATGQ